jgi:hypothetical protein
MAEVFRGWKRKTGLVLLLLACGLMALWTSRRFDAKWYNTAYYDVDEEGVWYDHRFDEADSNNFDPRRISFNHWQLGLSLFSGCLALCAAMLILSKTPSCKADQESFTASMKAIRYAGLTLSILCLIVCVGWMRSLTHLDSMSIQTGFESSLTVTSVNQNLCWSSYRSWDQIRWDPDSDRHRFRLPVVSWKSESVTNGIVEELTSDFDFDDQQRWQLWGFDFGHERGRIAIYYGWQETRYTVPYWAIVALFAALWVGLLLRLKCIHGSERP